MKGENKLTKKDLDQLNDLKAEINELEEKIIQLEQKKIDTTKDIVNASGNYFPYIQGHITVTGFDLAAEYRKEKAIESSIELLQRRKIKAQEAEKNILEFINNVDDSRLRRIMQYRYIDGYKLNKIAKIMHCDKSYPDKLITKYLAEYNKEH